MLTTRYYFLLQYGSSPRVWGNGELNRHPLAPPRFIPTRVGKWCLPSGMAAWVAVHPHACGEMLRQFTPPVIPPVHPHACGEMIAGAEVPEQPGVHPHACGEMVAVPVFGFGLVGSSPRVWGNVLAPGITAMLHRFIPTRVGKCSYTSASRHRLPVHPHACGEMGLVPLVLPGPRGSSPRVWGNGIYAKPVRFTGRFIPTRVGKWPPTAGRRLPYSVHPHACGEMFLWGENWRDTGGSSPRVWGNAAMTKDELTRLRFIPTRVGKWGGGQRFKGPFRFIPTRVGKCRPCKHIGRIRPVHPHACGEMAFCPPCCARLPGSSPRVWGNGQDWVFCRSGPRFIPTRVGK